MSNAAKGRALEHAIRNLFRSDGWSVVRGAGSKGTFDCASGIVKPDLIATKRGTGNAYSIQIILLQCKAVKL